MAYTVKQLADMSGVSVRTLHFYDRAALLKPAHRGANGYRFYEEAQLLRLQQILFYRELGFELKKIKRILGRPDFEVVDALRSHRERLKTAVARTRTLVDTIDRTIRHLKGETKMTGEEMFAGFKVPAGGDRLGEHIKLHGEPVDCKVSARDTGGAMAAFECTFGWPNHLNRDQDEWLYVIEGELECVVGDRHFCVGGGESLFIPRKVPHVWAPVGPDGARFVNTYQPAGDIEAFFRVIAAHKNLPTREQVLADSYAEGQIDEIHRLFDAYGMDLLPPPPGVEWPPRRWAENQSGR